MSSSRLLNFRPYDAEIEYLETDGNSYINLSNAYPVTHNSVTIWEGEIGYKNGNSGRRFLFSYSNTTVGHHIEVTPDNHFGISNALVLLPIQSDKLYNVKCIINGIDNLTAEIEDANGEIHTVVNTKNQGVDSTPIFLFRINNIYKGVGQRIGKNKLTYNGILRLDLVPVRVGQVGYMYDKVSGQLFGNAGTGSFTLGPDKTN